MRIKALEGVQFGKGISNSEAKLLAKCDPVKKSFWITCLTPIVPETPPVETD
jgi:hypothetical protein